MKRILININKIEEVRAGFIYCDEIKYKKHPSFRKRVFGREFFLNNTKMYYTVYLGNVS
ncbi:MAG: hypothetical protein ACJA2U_001342 [Marinomonas primoryensis]|jgi:hypothetical protein